MVTLKDFSDRELAIAINLITDCAVEIQMHIHSTENFFIKAGAEVPDQSWKREQVDTLAKLNVLLKQHMVDARMNEIIKSN